MQPTAELQAADPQPIGLCRLLDHLVGAQQNRWGNGEAKRLEFTKHRRTR
jgi:hypothetical protein